MLNVLTLLTSLATAAVMTPDDAVRAALASDPALAARRADVDAAAGLRSSGRFLGHNPEVEVSFSGDRSRLTGSVTQPLSITGEGLFASRSAGASLQAARAAVDRGRFETAATTRRAYARAVLGRELVRLAEDDRALLARLREVAEARMAAGEGVALDLRLARLEQARALSAWLDAHAQASVSDVELAALIGTTPGDLVRDPLVAAPVEMGAGAPRSDLIATKAATRAARSALSRERAAMLPAVGVGIAYEKDAGQYSFGPKLVLKVPLWNWNQSGIGAAKGSLKLAEAVERSTAARAATEELRAGERLRIVEESLGTLVADISAEAAPALRAIEGLFTSGEANLSETLLMRSRIVEGERAWIEARASIAIARIEVALSRQSASLVP